MTEAHEHAQKSDWKAIQRADFSHAFLAFAKAMIHGIVPEEQLHCVWYANEHQSCH